MIRRGGEVCSKETDTAKLHNLIEISRLTMDLYKASEDSVIHMEVNELLKKKSVNTDYTVCTSDSSCGEKELNTTINRMAEDDQRKRSQCCCRCSRERNVVKSRRSGSSESISASNVTEVGVSLPSDGIAVCSDQDSLKEESKYHTRLKSSARLQTNRRDNRLTLTKSLCHKVKAVLLTKKIMCQLVVLFIVLLCGGVLMLNHTPDKRDNRHHLVDSSKQHAAGLTYQDYIDSSETYQDSGDTRIIVDLPFRKVRREDFERHILNSKSSADMMKIFFDDASLTEAQVTTILRMKENPHLYSVRRHKSAVDIDMVDDAASQGDIDAMRQNFIDTAKNAMCKDPKPEVQRVENPDASTIRHYYPDCTVLHRCRNTSGCCSANEVCGPKEKHGTELITKYFMVIETEFPESEGEFIRPKSRNFIEERMFINHTACECRPVVVESNCHKRCPRQFSKRVTGKDCECMCGASNRLCYRMFHGISPIDEEDLECIKDGKCLEPNCARGRHFKVTNGFCSENHKRRRHHHGRWQQG